MSKTLRFAFILSLITIFYNIVEGVISIWFGLDDETLALLGFGVDSFVEVISGLGIAHMILRMRTSTVESRDRFERLALKITGTSFFLLTAGLITGAVINIIQKTQPDTTIAGIIISSISIVTMYLLVRFKLKVGDDLGSEAIIADAKCTRACLRLSFVLLGSSLLYMFFRIGYIDIAGSLIIAFLAFREGRESFEKAGSDNLSCCGGSCCETASTANPKSQALKLK